MRLLDEQVITLVGKTLDDIRSGDLSVEVYEVKDDDALSIRLVLVAGPRIAANAREQALANAGLDSFAQADPKRIAYRAPHERDACPSCGRVGGMREAGGLAWLCIACNAETSPFGAGG